MKTKFSKKRALAAINSYNRRNRTGIKVKFIAKHYHMSVRELYYLHSKWEAHQLSFRSKKKGKK